MDKAPSSIELTKSKDLLDTTERSGNRWDALDLLKSAGSIASEHIQTAGSYTIAHPLDAFRNTTLSIAAVAATPFLLKTSVQLGDIGLRLLSGNPRVEAALVNYGIGSRWTVNSLESLSTRPSTFATPILERHADEAFAMLKNTWYDHNAELADVQHAANALNARFGLPSVKVKYQEEIKNAAAVYNIGEAVVGVPLGTFPQPSTIAHELTHLEQDYLGVRYLADRLRIGADFSNWDQQLVQKYYFLKTLRPLSPEFAKESLVLRAGQVLNPDEVVRAKSLLKSSPALEQRWMHEGNEEAEIAKKLTLRMTAKDVPGERLEDWLRIGLKVHETPQGSKLHATAWDELQQLSKSNNLADYRVLKWPELKNLQAQLGSTPWDYATDSKARQVMIEALKVRSEQAIAESERFTAAYKSTKIELEAHSVGDRIKDIMARSPRSLSFEGISQ